MARAWGVGEGKKGDAGEASNEEGGEACVRGLSGYEAALDQGAVW